MKRPIMRASPLPGRPRRRAPRARRGAPAAGALIAALGWFLPAARPLTPASWAAPAPAAAPGVATPAFMLTAERGYFGDALAIDAAGGRLFAVRTDGATAAAIVVHDLATGAEVRTIPLASAASQIERLLPLAGGGGVAIALDPAGRRSALAFGADGKPGRTVGPFSDVALATRDGRPTLIGFSEKLAAGGDATVTLAPHDPVTLKTSGKARVLTLHGGRALKQPPFSLIAWQDGYTRALGERPGAYDRAADAKLPARAAVLDLFSRAFTVDGEIADVVAWTAAQAERRALPNRARYLRVAARQDGVELVSLDGRARAIPLAEPFARYDPRSLRDEEDADGSLTFALSIDPLNPEALARQKAEPAYLDVYTIAAGAEPVAPLARVLRVVLDERPVSWVAARGAFAVLRKHKSFGRGGTRIEVYR